MSNVRQDLKAIYTAAIAAVDPEAAVGEHLSCEKNVLQLTSRGRVIRRLILHHQPASSSWAQARRPHPWPGQWSGYVADRISEGCICVKHGYTRDLSVIEQIEASHPVPDASGMAGARKILEPAGPGRGRGPGHIAHIGRRVCAPAASSRRHHALRISGSTTSLLLKSGATIHEVNTVRKHLSLVKGGNLAQAAGRATVINLMISDVVGDDMDVIASGPFVPDKSTFADALRVLERYGLTGLVPVPVAERIRAGARGEIEENPGERSPVFNNVTNLIIASNIMALEAARSEAVSRGYNSLILSSMIEGDTKDAALWHARIAREIRASSNPVPAPACIVSGGETTVKVTGGGLGGRNMEFAMHAALLHRGRGGDHHGQHRDRRHDGPTDAAGAMADGGTAALAREQGN